MKSSNKDLAMQLAIGGTVGAAGLIATGYGVQYAAPADTNPYLIALAKAVIAAAGAYGLYAVDQKAAGAAFGTVMLAAAIQDTFEQAKTQISSGAVYALPSGR